MKANLALFASGLLFAAGLGISGMTDADKVIGFLNIAGEWDPSLAFVMVGAIGVHLVLFRLITRRASPLFAARFQIPTRKDLTPRLIGGAALFGAGWGLGGFCPGPALVSSTSLGSQALVFTAAMIFGMVAFAVLDSILKTSPEAPVEAN
jgi:uncharacterized membrane protein YedE/YeeE